MVDAVGTGRELYARIAELLAPGPESAGASFLVVLESGGRDVPRTDDPATMEEALAELVNAVPAAAATFLDTGQLYDRVWEIVLGTSAPAGDPDAPAGKAIAKILLDNQSDMELMRRASVRDPGVEYHVVRASPPEWRDEGGWTAVSFRLGGTGGHEPAGTSGTGATPPIIGNTTVVGLDDPLAALRERLVIPQIVPELEWTFPIEPFPHPPERQKVLTTAIDTFRRDDTEAVPVFTRTDGEVLVWKHSESWLAEMSQFRTMEAHTVPADPPDSGIDVSFEYRVVGISRPWLHAELFRIGGWTSAALGPGGLSDGSVQGNSGLMPVLTTRMLVVRNLEVSAEWVDGDNAASAVAFGPFGLTGASGAGSTTIRRPAEQVVAWLGAVVPSSPRV